MKARYSNAFQTILQVFTRISAQYHLLSHVSPSPLTLARVAGTLLVYRVQDTELEEFKWFSTQVKQCLDEEEVEELIESIHRTDAL